MIKSAGAQFRDFVSKKAPLQIVGVVNPYVAIMAKEVGFSALYLSGAGVSNMSYGLPDLGITSLENVLEDARRITDRVSLPLLVDIDTGWGSEHNIGRTIRLMEKAGVAAVHIEDQVGEKRCGHRPGKKLVSNEEMCERIKAAVNAKNDDSFVVMARTDAYAVEGLELALDRAKNYLEAGADMLFPEALPDLSLYRRFKELGAPVLCNLTEFGKTPLYTLEELHKEEIDMALYPLTAARVMNKAAYKALKELKEKGTQKDLVKEMQTREELYHFLQYYEFEK